MVIMQTSRSHFDIPYFPFHISVCPVFFDKSPFSNYKSPKKDLAAVCYSVVMLKCFIITWVIFLLKSLVSFAPRAVQKLRKKRKGGVTYYHNSKATKSQGQSEGLKGTGRALIFPNQGDFRVGQNYACNPLGY
jgi:hypothetical protein